MAVIATADLKTGVLMGAIAPTVATRVAIVHLGTAVNHLEPKKVLVLSSVRLMGLPVSTVAAWVVPRAWVIELAKARKSAPLPRLRLRVC